MIARVIAGWMIAMCLLISPVVASPVAHDTAKWVAVTFPTSPVRSSLHVMETIRATAALNDLPHELLVAVIATESNFKPKAKSPCGAKGLTQVISKYHRDKIKGRDLYQSEVAIEVGARILKDCHRKSSKLNRVLACYSGHQGKSVAKYVKTVVAYRDDFTAFQTLLQLGREPLVQTPSIYLASSTP